MKSLLRVMALLIPEMLKMRAGRVIVMIMAVLVIALSLFNGEQLATKDNEQDLINFMDRVVSSCSQQSSASLSDGGDHKAPD